MQQAQDSTSRMHDKLFARLDPKPATQVAVPLL